MVPKEMGIEMGMAMDFAIFVMMAMATDEERLPKRWI